MPKDKNQDGPVPTGVLVLLALVGFAVNVCPLIAIVSALMNVDRRIGTLLISIDIYGNAAIIGFLFVYICPPSAPMAQI